MLKTLFSSNKSLTTMLIKAQKNVFRAVVGDNNSKNKGSGYDFVELKEYTSGDDIKRIDWIISSKMDKPYVKVFNEPREINIVIAPILSGSIDFGLKVLKHDIVNEVCALISFSCVKQNDPFQSFICNDDVTLNTIRTKQLFGVRELVEKVASYNAFAKSINWKLIMSKLYIQLTQRSLIFLIGDFLGSKDLDFTVLSLRHEVIVIIVRDRFEEEPISFGDVNITDPVTQKSSFIRLDKKTSKMLKEKILKEDEILYEKFKKNAIKFVKIYTDENPIDKMLPLMKFS